MRRGRTLPNQINESLYKDQKVSLKKWVPISIAIIAFVFTINLPIKETIVQTISNSIKGNSNCPIDFESMDFSFFLPRINLRSPVIDGACYNRPGEKLKFNNLPLKVLRPSIYPPGIRLSTSIIKDKTRISIFPTIGYKSLTIRIAKSKVAASFINNFLPLPNLISGNFLSNGLITLKGTVPEEASLLIKSTNLAIPPRNISGLEIPLLNLGNFLIKAKLKNSVHFNIYSLIVGNAKSPIAASFKGKIKLNHKNMSLSVVDLTGKVKFSDSFIEAFPLIGLLLTGKKDKDDNYNLKITGTLGKLNKPQFL